MQRFFRPFFRLFLLLWALIISAAQVSVLAQQNLPVPKGKVDAARLAAQPKPIRVLVWDEQQSDQQELYPDFLGNHLVQYLRQNPALRVTSANINQPAQGLSKEVLDETDVLIRSGLPAFFRTAALRCS